MYAEVQMKVLSSPFGHLNSQMNYAINFNKFPLNKNASKNNRIYPICFKVIPISCIKKCPQSERNEALM
jgi:hypothetical protein